MTTKITFHLSPSIVLNATQGVLVGDFNNWNIDNGIQLKKQKDGSMKATVALENGKTYSYRYLLNDGRWVNDDTAQGYHFVSEFQIENCMIAVPNKVKKATTKKAEAVPKPPAKKATTKKAEAAPKPPAKKVTTKKTEPIVKATAKKKVSKKATTKK